MLWIVQGFPKETLVYLGLKFDIFSYWQRYPKSSLVKDLILYKIINLHGLNTTVHLYERHWNIVQLYLYTVSIARELQYFTARKSRQDSMKIFLLLLLGVLAAEASYNIYLTFLKLKIIKVRLSAALNSTATRDLEPRPIQSLRKAEPLNQKLIRIKTSRIVAKVWALMSVCSSVGWLDGWSVDCLVGR